MKFLALDRRKLDALYDDEIIFKKESNKKKD